MRKILLTCLLLLLFCGTCFADETINPNYIWLHTDLNMTVYLDTQSIRMDEKNNIIEVWFINFYTNQGKNKVKKDFGVSGATEAKTKVLFETSIKKYKTPYRVFYNDSNNKNIGERQDLSDWVEIPPDTIIDAGYKEVKKYILANYGDVNLRW